MPLQICGHEDKWMTIRCTMTRHPEEWFRDTPIEQRDKDLLAAKPVPFIEYGERSYLRSIYAIKDEGKFQTIPWTVENDIKLRSIVSSTGGQLIGEQATSQEKGWSMVKVSVNIANNHAKPGLGWEWGMMGTRPSAVRIFKGSKETCATHSWDAMILRDVEAHTEKLYDFGPIHDYRWDILCVKCCEDFDQPWLIAAMLPVGPRVPRNCDGSLKTEV